LIIFTTQPNLIAYAKTLFMNWVGTTLSCPQSQRCFAKRRLPCDFHFSNLFQTNMKQRNFRGLAARFALLALVFTFSLSEALATHFRYGSMTWTNVSGNTVQFQINQAYRRSFFGAPVVGSSVYVGSMNFGDGTFGDIYLTVTSVNLAEDWFFGTATLVKTYSSNATRTASFESCCRLSTLANDADGGYRTETVVNPGVGNNSPVATIQPIVNLQTGLNPAQFQISAFDPDGSPITYSLATNAQKGGGPQPTGLTISPSGLVSFSTMGQPLNRLFTMQAMVSDGVSRIPVDFLIRIVNTSTPPTFNYAVTPINGQTFSVQPGQNINFDVEATDVDPGDVVNLSVVGQPLGATFMPGLPANGNPVSTDFSWTPGMGDLGTRVVTFTAQDLNGVQTSTSVNIVVSLDPIFNVPPTLPFGSITCIEPNELFTTTIEAYTPDNNASVQITSATIPGGTLTPMLPSTAGVTTSVQFDWTPMISDWGMHALSFTATDIYNNTTVHNYELIVNSAPYFTSSIPAFNSVEVGEYFEYIVTFDDPDLNDGDTAEIHHPILPSWLTHVHTGPLSIKIFGTPTAADLGLYDIELEVVDIHHHACASFEEQMFQIEVVPASSYTRVCLDDFVDPFPSETFVHGMGGFIHHLYNQSGLEVGALELSMSPNNDQVGEPIFMTNRSSEIVYQTGLAGAVGGTRWAWMRHNMGTSGNAEASIGGGLISVDNESNAWSSTSLRYGSNADLNLDLSALSNIEFVLSNFSGNLTGSSRQITFTMNLISGIGTPGYKSKAVSIVMKNDGEYVIPVTLPGLGQVNFGDIDRINIGWTDQGTTGGNDYSFGPFCARSGNSMNKNYAEITILDDPRVEIFPVPANDVLNLEVETFEDRNLSFTIVDLMGRTVLSGESPIALGLNAFSFNTSALANGVYTLVLIQQGEIQNLRFSVVH